MDGNASLYAKLNKVDAAIRALDELDFTGTRVDRYNVDRAIADLWKMYDNITAEIKDTEPQP